MLRTELVLARPSVEPLARLAPKPDPLQPFAAAIGRLRSVARRRASASTCCRRAACARRGCGAGCDGEARRIHGERRDWAALLNGEAGPPPPARPPRAGRAPRGGAGASTRSCASPASCSRRRSSCAAEAPSRGQAKAAMSGLLAAFRPLAGRNYLRASGLPIPGIAFLGSDIPLRRRRFDRRFATGLFRPARKTILTARELAGLPEAADRPLRRAKRPALGRAALPAARAARPSRRTRRPDPARPGRRRVGRADRRRPDRRHLLHLHRRPLALRQDRGGDRAVRPHRPRRVTAASSSTPTATAWSGSSPTSPTSGPSGWCGSTSAPAARRRAARLEPLRAAAASAAESEARVEAIVDAFASALEWGERSTRAINLTTQAAAALAAIAGASTPSWRRRSSRSRRC